MLCIATVDMEVVTHTDPITLPYAVYMALTTSTLQVGSHWRFVMQHRLQSLCLNCSRACHEKLIASRASP